MRVRPLRPEDHRAVRALFVETAAAGRPLRLPGPALQAYTSLCLDYYLEEAPSPCAVLVDGDAVIGYTMVALDDAAHRRWAGPRAARWAAGSLAGSVAASSVRGFVGRRILDGVVAAVTGPQAPAPAHFHFNVVAGRRGLIGGFLLAAHADAVVQDAGLRRYLGEVNVPVAKPGRAAALERLGVRVVHRQRNHTLSWLAGEPVDRLTTVRAVTADEGWVPLPHAPQRSRV